MSTYRSLLVAMVLILPTMSAAQDSSTEIRDRIVTAQERYEAARNAGSLDDLQEAYNTFNVICTEQDNLARANVESDRELAALCADLMPVALYSRGWCQFRIAELTEDSAQYRAAFDDFADLANREWKHVAPARYMAGEARLREVQVIKYHATADGSLREVLGPLSEKLDRADSFFATVRASTDDALLKACASIRALDSRFETAKLFQAAGEHAEAIAILVSLDYGTLPGSVQEGLMGVVDYSDAMVALNRLMMEPGFAVNDDGLLFGDEQTFRRASLDHVRGVQLLLAGDEVSADTRLRSAISTDQRSLSYPGAASSVPEAHYWRGYIELIENDANASSSFDSFVRATAAVSGERLEKIRSDAQAKRDLVSPTTDNLTDEQVAGFLRNVPASDRQRTALSHAKYLIMRASQERPGTSSQKRFLRKALAFCTYVRIRQQDAADALLNEAKFYYGIGDHMLGRTLGDAQKIAKYCEVADLMLSITGDYEVEAKYIAAYNLYSAYETPGGTEQQGQRADRLFQELVSVGSVRALYYWGSLLGKLYDSPDAREYCFQIVACRVDGVVDFKWLDTKVGTPCAWNGSGQTNHLSRVSDRIKALLQRCRVNDVRCPDILSKADPVYFEKLALTAGARRLFAEESLEMLGKYSLPKRSLYPAHDAMPSSRLTERRFAAIDGPVDDILWLDRQWRLMASVYGTDASGAFPLYDCTIRMLETGGRQPLQQLQWRDDFYRSDPIQSGDTVLVVIECPGYYTHCEVIPPRTFEDLVLSVNLSRRVRYRPDRAADGWRSVALGVHTDSAYQLVRSSDADSAVTATLQNTFARSVFARDLCSTGDPAASWVLDSRARKAVRPAIGGGAAEVRLPAGSSWRCPEGIALDSRGRFFIADCSEHCIFMCDPSGSELLRIGAFGRNTTADDCLPARFVLPTRVAIGEDQGEYGGSIPPRQTHVFVADRYGIHRCDSQGRYIESLDLGGSGVVFHEIHDLAVSGYGIGSKLYVVNKAGEMLVFNAVAAD